MSSVNSVANAIFNRFDRNHDGVIELAPGRDGRIEGSRSGGGDRAFVFLSNADYNRDYKLDRFELSTAIAKQVDTNGNGSVSAFERFKLWFQFKI